MNYIVCNHFSSSIPTFRISDILKSEDYLKNGGSEQTNSFNSIKELIIGKDCFRNTHCNLIINNYPNLEKIWIKPNNLVDIESLTISDNERLREIVVEGVECNENNDVFGNVKSVVLKGIF